MPPRNSHITEKAEEEEYSRPSEQKIQDIEFDRLSAKLLKNDRIMSLNSSVNFHGGVSHMSNPFGVVSVTDEDYSHDENSVGNAGFNQRVDVSRTSLKPLNLSKNSLNSSIPTLPKNKIFLKFFNFSEILKNF